MTCKCPQKGSRADKVADGTRWQGGRCYQMHQMLPYLTVTCPLRGCQGFTSLSMSFPCPFHVLFPAKGLLILPQPRLLYLDSHEHIVVSKGLFLLNLSATEKAPESFSSMTSPWILDSQEKRPVFGEAPEALHVYKALLEKQRVSNAGTGKDIAAHCNTLQH